MKDFYSLEKGHREDLHSLVTFNVRTIFKTGVFLVLVMIFVLMGSNLNAQNPNLRGVAPVDNPTGGFDIDADLYANFRQPSTATNFGDWIYDPIYPGTGRGVLNILGTPIDPLVTRHSIDLTGNADSDGFTEGSKFNMSPEDWVIEARSSPGKDDMQNVMIHFDYDASGDLWFMMAGDRKETNGTSYLDFELFQKTVALDGDGGYTSAGTDGGRTVGDLVISIEYSQGGARPQVFVYRWESVGTKGGVEQFDYVEYTTSAGTVYAASNIEGPVSVPYGAFGSTTYAQYAFVEAAVNLFEVIPDIDRCKSIATILIKTKASDALNAALKDVVEPIQIEINPNPAPTIANLALCESVAGGGSASFNLNEGVTDADGGTITFHTSQAFADAGTNAIETPETYVSLGETIFVRSYNSVTTCYGTTSFTLTVYDNPVASFTVDDACEVSGDDITVVNTSTASEGGTLGYTWSVTDNLDAEVATSTDENPSFDLSPGDYTISLTVTESGSTCTDTTSESVTVYDNPDLTADEVCVGDTVDMGIGSGTYSSSDTTVATIDSDGVVTGVGAGTSTISFENTNGCSDTAIVTVYANPDLTADEVCVGDTVDMGIGSGTYSSSNTAVATVDSDGVVTGVSAGTSTISFENTNGCSDTAIVTVYANPDLTADEVCVGNTVDMGIGSGTYSSSNTAVATVDSDGVVTGVSAGTSTISFENTNGCSDTAIVTVYANPDLTADEVCVGDTVDMGIGSGTYSSSNTAVATVDSDGVVTGVSAGTSTISFENTNGCSDTAIVTVYANPDLTADEVCVGDTVDMGIGSGTYSSSNTAVATVDSDGVVTGVSAGTSTISFENTNGCSDTAIVTVYANPDLTADEVCVGDTVDMGIGSGTYSSSNTAVATVDSDGVVTGVSAGTSTISFENTNGCSDTAIVTVYANPDLTADEVCVGDTVDMGIGSGTYSSSNTAVATVDSDGVVTGVSAGTSTISFENTNGCSDTAIVTVYANPDLTADEVCVGDTVDMGIGSGTYSSSNTAVATVDSDGVVTGVSAGTSTISFENTNGCSDTAIVTVYANPDLTADEVCVGDTVDMGIGSGTYSSSNTAVATVDSDGVVTGVSAGTSTISFENTNGCSDTATVTVYANPDLTGDTVCVDQTVNMGIGAGDYSSSNELIATVDENGVVYGVSAGTATITYENSNGCSDTATITVENCIVDQGCTPGYWKNHLKAWGDVDPNADFFEFFDINPVGVNVQDILGNMDQNGDGELSLLEAISAEVKTSKNNGWFAALARHAVAAYLNATNPDVGYEYSAYYIWSQTQLVFEGPVGPAEYRNRNEANAAAQELHNKFRIANERVCPLGNESSTVSSTEITTKSMSEPVEVQLIEATVVNDIAVYPNPFSDGINVKYDISYTSDVTIEVFDFGGNLLRTVKDSNVSRGSTTSIVVDFSISANQMYLLRVSTDRDVFVKQIVSSKK